MGKNTGQRTKNNAKPSKSNRSAELLYKASPNFVGTGAENDGSCKSILPVLLTKSFKETTINEIDSPFLLVFKKLSKKDTTTKFKALQEFITLCNDSPLSSVEIIIPYWPKIYCMLSVDFEHKIREAVQLAHGALIRRVGKSIAAHLKQFAAYWFTSQFDTYAPVASAATKSFQETFSGKKYTDAIIHCQNEILSYIRDGIIHNTLPLRKNSELNNDDSDLLAMKQQRILTCCLQGYCFYLKNIPAEQLNNTIEIHKEIITSPNFWKFSECNVSVIKIAFFNIIMLIIENASDLLIDKKKKIITTVVNNINENDPGVVVAVWECFFMILNKYDDWHKIINVEKLMLPKLWNLLKNGAHGCANTIFPALLPLIHQFYKFDFDMKNFFISLFNNIRHSFNIKAVQNSYSERLIIAKSFTECLRYALMMNCKDVEFSKQLVEEQLMSTIELYITVYPSKKTDIFNEISSLVRYWSKNRTSEKDQCYGELMKTFWDKLELMFETLITNTNDRTYESPKSIHEMGIELLFFLYKPKLSSCKNTCVKFEDTSDSKQKPTHAENPVYQDDDQFDKELQNFVNKLCIKYFNETYNNSMNIYISIITFIISRFGSESLFKSIASSYNYNNLLEFYNNIMLKHLIEESKEHASSIGVIFSFIQYMTDEERSIVLNSLAELNDSQVLMDVITQGLMEKNIRNISVKKFFKSNKVTECFHEIIRKFISCSSNKSIKNLLIQAFQTVDNDFCVSKEAVQDIINVMCDTLKTSDDISQDVIELFVHILRITWNHEQLADANSEMLRILIQINTTNTYTEDLKNVLQNYWINELQFVSENFSKNKILNIQENCMKTIYEIMFSADQFNEDATEIAHNLIEYSSGCNYCEAIRALYSINGSKNSSIKDWTAQLQNIISNAEIITGNYYTINPTQSLSFEPPSTIFTSVEVESLSKKIIHCNQWALLNVTLLNDFFKKFINHDTTDELEQFFHDNLSDTFVILNDILLIMSLSKLYLKHYKFTNSYNSVWEIYNQLEQKFAELQTLIPTSTFRNIFTTCINFDHCWSEFGSIFLQYLSFYNNSYLLEIQSSERKILEEYFKLEKTSLNLIDHSKAILSARNMLNHSSNHEEIYLPIELLNKLIKIHKNEEYFFLLKEDLSSISWIQLNLTLEVIRLFTKSVITVPTKLDNKVWDSVMIYLTSWLRSLNNYKNHYKDLKLQCLTVASCQLFCAIQNLMNEQKSTNTNQLLSELIDEWNNVFVHDIKQEVMNIWMYYGKVYDKKCDNLPALLMLHYLGDAIRLIDESFFLTLNENPETSVETQSLKNLSLELMLSPVISHQLSAYYILNFSVPALVEQDKILIKEEEPDYTKSHIHDFFNILSRFQEIVNAMLEDFKLCDSVKCIIQPHTDSYTYVLGYFLTWVNILKMCEIANTNLRCQYAEILKEEYFWCLMNNIFKMMPVNMFEETNIKVPNARLVKLFQVSPSLDFHNDMSTQKIDHIVCWLYVICLRNLPVLTRQWWSTVNSKVSNLVEKITTVYVSPILCQEELSDKKLSDFANMQIKIHRASREVIALYQMDDTQLELNITLPTSYPLEAVSVKPGRRVNNAMNWKNYHMQLSIFLTHQNGSIWEGLKMWKKNLDKRFSGVEECYICFSIFHISTYQIPKLSCHTCRKKFHAPCLYKWFSTSQKSTCPICRNIF